MLFVVGLIGDVLADDEHFRNLYGGSGVVALLEAAAHFHDTAFGVGEVVLVLIARAFLGRLGGSAAWLFAGALFLGLAGSELFLIGGLPSMRRSLARASMASVASWSLAMRSSRRLISPGMVRPSWSGVLSASPRLFGGVRRFALRRAASV